MTRDVPEELDIEQFRELLNVTAQLDLDPWLHGKVDLSGVVQQTLLEAHLGKEAFRGRTEGELLAWLRRILVHNLIDEIRKFDRAGFDAKREVSLQQSSRRLEALLETDFTPPEERVSRQEEIFRLTQALLRLPVDQRQAVMRHHLQGMALADVAAELGRTREAVAGLLHRGLVNLRELLTRVAIPVTDPG